MNKQTLKQLIKTLKLDWVNENITDKNFPDKSRKGLGPVELMKIDTEMTTVQVLDKIKADGYIPANSYELFEWAKDWNGRDLIIAFGSQWTDAFGGLRVLNLWGGADARKLYLVACNPGDRWGRFCLFARRKIKVSAKDND